jgi:hypothetical protein
MVNTRNGLLVSGRTSCGRRRLRSIFCQTSDSVPSRNWSSSEIQQWMLSDTMWPSPAIRSHCPLIPPPHNPFLSSAARLVWQLGHGSRLSTMQTRYIASQSSFLSTHHHQVITLDPLSPWGYEMKHAALHKAGDFVNAVDVLETMLSKIAQSPDLDTSRESYLRYHDKDDLFTSFDRAWRQVYQPIEHTSNDSRNCSTDHTSFATCAHQHDHWSSLQ